MRYLPLAFVVLFLGGCMSKGGIPTDPQARMEFITEAKLKLNIETNEVEGISKKIKEHIDIAVLPVDFIWDIYQGEDYAEPDDNLGSELLECALLDEQKGRPILFDEILVTQKIYKDLVDSIVAKQYIGDRTPVRVQTVKQTRSLLEQFDLGAPGATRSVSSGDLAEFLDVDAVIRTDFIAPLFGEYIVDPDAFATYKRKLHTTNVAVNAGVGLLTGNVFAAAGALGGIAKDAANEDSCGELWAEHVAPQNYLCPRSNIITMRLDDSSNETIWSAKRDCVLADTMELETRWDLFKGVPVGDDGEKRERPKTLLPSDTFKIMINELPYDQIVFQEYL